GLPSWRFSVYPLILPGVYPFGRKNTNPESSCKLLIRAEYSIEFAKKTFSRGISEEEFRITHSSLAVVHVSMAGTHHFH
ncbi:MAG: hypothetical protein KJN62_04150, partial [Deltaproteobacteria bacterium]|nr:hypothetical protein [Deltaproteobacteria bacterium]